MKRVLLLAGNGFIGTAIQEKLNKEIDIESIIVIDEKIKRFKNNICNKVILINNSINDTSKISEVINNYKITHVIYLYSATIPATSNSMIDVDIKHNLLNFIKILDILIKSNIKKFIYASSGGAIYGNVKQNLITENVCSSPTSSYGIIKHTCEQYLSLYNKLYGFNSISLRISNPFGPRQDPSSKQGVIAKFVHNTLKNNTLEIWGDGETIKDYVFIEDVAEAFVKSLDNSYTGKINIGSGYGTSINDLIFTLEKILLKKIEKKYISQKSYDIRKNILSIHTAKVHLKWEPSTHLDDAILKTINWQKEYYEL